MVKSRDPGARLPDHSSWSHGMDHFTLGWGVEGAQCFNLCNGTFNCTYLINARRGLSKLVCIKCLEHCLVQGKCYGWLFIRSTSGLGHHTRFFTCLISFYHLKKKKIKMLWVSKTGFTMKLSKLKESGPSATWHLPRPWEGP